jgi:PKD repeat protein
LTSEIVQIDPAELTCEAVVTFDDVSGGDAPGTNYDGVFESGNAALAERFVGQTLSYSGDFDVLSGTPAMPLTLQVGLPYENLCVYHYYGTDSQVMPGCGPLGWPASDAIGEGSFAILFDYDQSEFGFDLVGGNDGSCTVNFFRRDGTLIDSHTISGLADISYGFRRVGGIYDIAGVSVHNEDLAGIGVDNICHDVSGVPGFPPVCMAVADPTITCVGADVVFDGTGSYDPDGTIVSYEWDFGDGSPTVSGAVVTHAYEVAGAFVATLCVTDDEGNESCCSVTVTVELCVIPVPVDIKPTSCPNPLNTKSNGVLPVAVLGTETFDIVDIDAASILLEGVAPLRWTYEDVGTPFEGELCDCHDEGADGYIDLMLHFSTQDIVAALGEVTDREVRQLFLTAVTFDGVPVEGSDCVRILHKVKDPPPPDPVIVVATLDGTGSVIQLSLEETTHTTAVVYDVLGKTVKTLVNGTLPAGTHTISWDGTDAAGSSMANGIYFCRVQAGNISETAKFAHIR